MHCSTLLSTSRHSITGEVSAERSEPDLDVRPVRIRVPTAHHRLLGEQDKGGKARRGPRRRAPGPGGAGTAEREGRRPGAPGPGAASQGARRREQSAPTGGRDGPEGRTSPDQVGRGEGERDFRRGEKREAP